ncbi:porin family protein [Elizabethkingia sp. JS20170427COW]|uniref:type IX secretion/gliding motility protein PorT/SprT n=1 Tax=Elizabethkingia sp. JS20170427COW TaxID=2583851 RepID=UPI0011106159|nr:porin family protein [Elizabethkingia sp. JS20170427COW]QCX54002.1 PorT family protein [Elizabethkingia sp. JS20170427COW]
MKNKILTSVLLAFLGGSTQAQLFNTRNRMDNLEGFDQQKFSWGFYLAANSFGYKMTPHPQYGLDGSKNAVTEKSSMNFGAGLIGRMRINDNFDLRIEPALQFVDRELQFNTFDKVNQNYDLINWEVGNLIIEPKDADKIRKVKSTYVDVPILLEYHGSRWYNSRPYAAAGLNWMTNLQSNEKVTDDNQLGIFRTTSSNFAWSAEMGMQFYFSRFKLTTGVRGTFIFNNELVKDNPGTPAYWAGAIDQLNSRAVMFVLKFE